jgi:hypothetical protein
MGLIKNVHQLSPSNIQFQQQKVYNLSELTTEIRDSGFEILESGSYSLKIFTHRQMQDLIDKNYISEEMLNAFYKMEKYFPNFGSEIYVNAKLKNYE